MLDEIESILTDDPHWAKFTIKRRMHQHDGSFSINDRVSEVCATPGPIVVCSPVQTSAFERFRARVHTRTIVEYIRVVDFAETIWQAIETARQRFESGEPFLPRKYVVALLVLWKLDHQMRWGGNNKSFMWGTDIPKGRGIPPELADDVPEVVSDLLLAGILNQKPSRTSTKYCLNADRRQDINDIMDCREYPDPNLPKHIRSDRHQVTARLLEDGRRLWTARMRPG